MLEGLQDALIRDEEEEAVFATDYRPAAFAKSAAEGAARRLCRRTHCRGFGSVRVVRSASRCC